jgi:hypothetical protein
VAYGGFPIRPPGAATSSPYDAFVTAPVYVEGLGGVGAGVIAYGSSTGKVFFIDQRNASSAPALIKMFHYGSPVSSVAYRTTGSSSGVFMVSTADGHTFLVNSADVVDPSPTFN